MKTRLTAVAATLLLGATQAAQAGTAAGTQISNTATATYLDPSLGNHTATSNTVVTTVAQVASLTVNANAAKTAAAGGTVVYTGSVTNTGNGSDTFSLAATNSGAFTMTGVVFYLDADGNGQADNSTPITSTGALAAGATFRYVAVATLPGSATVGTSNAMVVTATSAFNASVNATTTDTTTVTAGATMDITGNQPNTLGAGAGAEATAVATNVTTAGTTTRFNLYLNNAGGSADTFNLAASTDSTFGSLTLPSGWTVVFKDSSGNVITNATVNAGAQVLVYADVTPPAGATVGTTDLFFRALSPTSGVSDKIHEAVTITASAINVTLVKTQALDANCDGVADTAFSTAPITVGAVPGACIRYQITATNSGTTTVTNVTISDNIPANTTYQSTNGAAVTLGSITSLLTGTVTSVVGVVPTMTAGQSAVLSLGVKIN